MDKIDLNMHITTPKDFTDCDPIIAKALRNNKAIKVQLRDNACGDLWVTGYMPHGKMYELRRELNSGIFGWTTIKHIQLMRKKGPRKGDGKLYMFWDSNDIICYCVGEYSICSCNEFYKHKPLSKGESFMHCTEFNAGLIRLPISDWPDNLEVW